MKNSFPTPAASLARFACDYCRDKKIKCSREVPKCAACRPWPSACIYSRGASTSSRTMPIAIKEDTTSTIMLEADIIPLRLQRIEQALERLTLSLNTVLATAATGFEPGTFIGSNTASAPVSNISEGKGLENPSLFIGASHSFASLEQASQDLSSLNEVAYALPEHQEASKRLHSLSNTLRTASINDASMRTCIGTAERFFVPSKSLGYGLLGHVLHSIEMADVMTSRPSDELLMQVIFAPDSVPPCGWVVYVNFILLAFALNDGTLGHLVNAFRGNTRRAMNDASLFLEPKLSNIQALMIMACHGEEFASPNLSWMLLGHACRQAQALGLHLSDSCGTDDEQRALALFWSLFIMDKTCSLAFGRPVFLAADTYRKVPEPLFSHLLRYQPHQHQLQNDQGSTSASTFGACFFSQSISLAKLTGHVLDSMAVASPSPAPQVDDFVSQLEDWNRRTHEVLTEARNKEQHQAGAQQLREMALGIQTMRFQYFHIMILLVKENPHYNNIRLHSAREAIGLLPELVSGYAQVYNGIVWQLLYYPFTPFFTIFRNILRDPTAVTVDGDVKLLSTTVTYFQRMEAELKSLSSVSSRLCKTANLFLALARAIASGTLSVREINTGLTFVRKAQESVSMEEVPTLSTGSSITVSHRELSQTLCSHVQETADISFQDMDIEILLQCLVPEPEPQSPRGQKRPFDTTFDWFSWNDCCSGDDWGTS